MRTLHYEYQELASSDNTRKEFVFHTKYANDIGSMLKFLRQKVSQAYQNCQTNELIATCFNKKTIPNFHEFSFLTIQISLVCFFVASKQSHF